MKKPGRLSSFIKPFYLILTFLMVMGFGTSAHAEWNYGIGTGFAGMSVDGDVGFHTNIAGPVQSEVDLSAEDVADLMASAFGLGGYATDGTWMVQGSLGFLKLEDKPSYSAPGVVVTSEFNFDISFAELTVGYAIYKDPSVIVRVLGGVRYTGHKLEAAINAVVGAATASLAMEIDEAWADALIGLTVDVPFARTWSWNNRIDGGFGGSEGTFYINTGLTWAFAKHWAGTLSVDYKAVEYENGNVGDTDWYLYDANETTGGIKILYRW